MRMRKNKGLERPPTAENVWQHCRATSVSSAPSRASVEQKPATAICSKQDRISLTYVEYMELDPIAM